MSYGNPHFRSWLRLLLFLFPLLLALRASASGPSVSAFYSVTGNWGPWGVTRTQGFQVDGSGTWNATTRKLAVTVSANFTGSGIGGVGPNDAPPNIGYVEWGSQRRVNGVLSDPSGTGPQLYYNDTTKVAVWDLAQGDEIRLWVRVRFAWADQARDSDYYYSGWFSGDGPRYRRLDFTVTNGTASNARWGIWATSGVGADGIARIFPVPMGTLFLTGPWVAPGASAVASLFTSYDDAASYFAGIIDWEGSKAAFGGPPQLETGELADGCPVAYWSGALALADYRTAIRPASAGVIVDTVPFLTDGVSDTVPGGGALPIDGSKPGVVADGSTGPATGREVTDAANAQMAQAHADAAALQKSVEGVGAKIDALGSKLGDGMGTGGGDSERATAAADAAQATKDAMGDGTSASNGATGFAQGHGDTMKANATSAVGQFGVSPTITEETGSEPLEKITIKIY